MHDSIKVDLFGTPAVFCATSARQIFLPHASMKVLLYLATKPKTSVHRMLAIEDLWPDTPPEQALSRLSTTLWRLNKALGLRDAVIKAPDHTISLGPDMVVDTHMFETVAQHFIADDAQATLACFDGVTFERLSAFEGWFDPWALRERTRLENLWERCLEVLLKRQEDAQDFGAALRTADQMLDIDPLREDMHAARMRIFCKQNRPAMARQQFKDCAKILKQELNVNPGQVLQTILHHIESQRTDAPPRAAPPSPPTDVRLIQDLVRQSRTDLRKISEWLETQV